MSSLFGSHDIGVKTQVKAKSSGRRTRVMIIAVVLILLAAGLGVGLGIGLGGGTPAATAYRVETTIVASGTVSDYDSVTRIGLRINVATELGVPASAVSLQITAASVNLKFSVSYDNPDQAAAGSSALATKLSNTSAASALLSTPSKPVVVESIASLPSVVTATASPPPPPPARSGPPPLPPSPPPPVVVGIGLPAALSLVSTTSATSRRRMLDALKRGGSRRLNTQPVSGAYVSDFQQEFLEDRLNQFLRTPQEIMCMLAAAAADKQVNKGACARPPHALAPTLPRPRAPTPAHFVSRTDIALADEKKCARDTSTKTQGAGSSSSSLPLFHRMEVNSSRASNSAPMVVEGHVELVDHEYGEDTQGVWFHMTVTADKEQVPPNGAFHLEYTLRSLALIDPSCTRHCDIRAGKKLGKGTLTASAAGVAWAESGETDIGDGTTPNLVNLASRVFANVDEASDSGIGAADHPVYVYPDGFTNQLDSFGYSADYFCRADSGSMSECFDRAREEASETVWLYALYNEDGSPHYLTQPGFTIKTMDGQVGFANYYGIWLPEGSTPKDGSKVVADGVDGGAKVTFSVDRLHAKLHVHTRVGQTLDAVSKVPFSFNSYNPVTSPSGTTYITYSRFEAFWDAASQLFHITSSLSGSDTGYTTTATPGWTVTAAQLDNFTASYPSETYGCSPDVCPPHRPGIDGWSEGLGYSTIHIPSSALHDASPGAATNGMMSYKTQVAHPDTPGLPTSFTCAQHCPTAVTVAAANVASPYTSGTATSNGIDPASAVTYSWSTKDYALRDATGAAVNAAILGPGTGTDGIRITLVAASAAAATLKCDWDATKYCSWQAFSAPQYFTYEFGPNEWNQATALKRPDGTIVDFSQPEQYTFQVPANDAGKTTPYGEFAGSSLQLLYEGEGQLWGIPEQCFCTTTNLPADCGPAARHVAAFSIPFDASGYVVNQATGAKKWVKWLEKEVRFKYAPSITPSAQGITLGDATKLPAAPPLTNDPNDPSDAALSVYAGAWPSAATWDGEIAVLHGVVQTDCWVDGKVDTTWKRCPGLDFCIPQKVPCPVTCTDQQKSCQVVDYDFDVLTYGGTNISTLTYVSEKTVCLEPTATCPCGANTARCPGTHHGDDCIPIGDCPKCKTNTEKQCVIYGYDSAGNVILDADGQDKFTTICVPHKVACPCGDYQERCQQLAPKYDKGKLVHDSEGNPVDEIFSYCQTAGLGCPTNCKANENVCFHLKYKPDGSIEMSEEVCDALPHAHPHPTPPVGRPSRLPLPPLPRLPPPRRPVAPHDAPSPLTTAGIPPRYRILQRRGEPLSLQPV